MMLEINREATLCNATPGYLLRSTFAPLYSSPFRHADCHARP